MMLVLVFICYEGGWLVLGWIYEFQICGVDVEFFGVN